MGLLNSSDEKELLLYRKWLSANKTREDKTQLVCNIALSSSGEWIKISTTESLALIKADSKVGEDFWNELKKFSGKAKALIIFPDKGKLGFDLDFHESKTAFYEWSGDELLIGKKQETQASGISSISWKKAQIPSKNAQVLPIEDGSTSEEGKPSEESSGILKTTSKQNGKVQNKPVNES